MIPISVSQGPSLATLPTGATMNGAQIIRAWTAGAVLLLALGPGGCTKDTAEAIVPGASGVGGSAGGELTGGGAGVSDTCVANGETCTVATDCCSLSCVGGRCDDTTTCKMVGQDCAGDEDCCSNRCADGSCADTGSICVPAGEACRADSACCSGACSDLGGTLRCVLVSTCRGGGEVCQTDGDCCSGVCGDDGLCPVMAQCQTAGEPCTGHHECCSGTCADPGSGVPVCHFVSGCRPIGEVCDGNTDCCSAQCEPYENTGISRCVKPGGCMDTGEVCWSGQAANCCPTGANGGQQLCQDTLLGVSRCFGPSTVDTCLSDGNPCQFGDECCGGRCLPTTDGALLCGADCAKLAGACRADADCCDGLCIGEVCKPDVMDCAPLGRDCETDDSCCAGVCGPEAGVCVVPDGG